MKKVLLLVVLAATVLACGTPKTVIESKKVIKGYWSLDNISYSESGNFNVTIFNDTSKECFEGTTWRFIPNNNSGTYTVDNNACPTGDRNFIFSIVEESKGAGVYDFLLKPTMKQGKPDKDNAVGFRVNLAQLSDTSMRWQQTVMLEGKPFKINMNFSKIEE